MGIALAFGKRLNEHIKDLLFYATSHVGAFSIGTSRKTVMAGSVNGR
jgi:hypothetical protein